jgi:peptidoglycan hydrolase-like protein with peptidoglycan-binding domain
MRDQLNFEAEPFESYAEFDGPLEASDSALADEAWEEEVRRGWWGVGRSPGARFSPRRRPVFPRSPGRPPRRRPPGRPPRRRPPGRPRPQPPIPWPWPIRPLEPVAVPEPPGSPPDAAGSPPNAAGAASAPAGAGPVPDGTTPPEAGSEYVRWIQHALNQIMGLQLPVDGTMGPEVRNAIRSFQQQQGLPVDGIVGPDTQQALIAARASRAPAAGNTAASAPTAEELAEETDSFPASVLRALSNGLESVAVKLAVGFGYRDEEQLTNLVFFTRHPERRSRKLDRREPEFHRLSQEWLDIRNRLVRPALQASGQRPTRPAPPSTAGAWTPTRVQTLRATIVRIANQEFERWRRGTVKETDSLGQAILREYYTEGVRSSAREANIAIRQRTAWSAVFISWVMRKTGAGDAFRYSRAHVCYVEAAKNNRLANTPSPFRAYRIHEVKPQVGDIVCTERHNSGVNYDNVTCHPARASHGDIVTAVQGNRVTVIGGNVGNTVGRKTLFTNAQGYIDQTRERQRGYFAVIKLILPQPTSTGT